MPQTRPKGEMKKTFEIPEFNDRGWYPIGVAAAMLNINRTTLLNKSKLGRKRGGIDFKVGRNGRKKFLGKELTRFYNEM